MTALQPAGFDGAGAEEPAQVAVAGVAHPDGVGLEVGQGLVPVGGLDPDHGVFLGGGDDRFDVAGVQVSQPVGEPLVGVGDDERDGGGQVVQVFAGVPDVHDLGRGGQELAGQVPDPGRAVAQDDELADVVAAAVAGLGGDQGPELVGGGEGGEVAGRAGIADGVSVSSSSVWVNRQASLTSWVRARPSSGRFGRPVLAGRSSVSAGVIGTPVPSIAT